MDHLVLGRRAVLVHPVKSHSIAVSIIACCISLACHWFSVLSTMINSPNRGKKGCWNKQAKLKYKPNGCIDYSMKSIIMPLQVFLCVYTVCVSEFEHVWMYLYRLTTGPGIPRRPSGPGFPGGPWGPTGPVLPAGPSAPASPCMWIWKYC